MADEKPKSISMSELANDIDNLNTAVIQLFNSMVIIRNALKHLSLRNSEDKHLEQMATGLEEQLGEVKKHLKKY